MKEQTKKHVSHLHLYIIKKLVREKGISTLRIYRNWIFHHTNDYHLFREAKINKTQAIMTLFKL